MTVWDFIDRSPWVAFAFLVAVGWIAVEVVGAWRGGR